MEKCDHVYMGITLGDSKVKPRTFRGEFYFGGKALGVPRDKDICICKFIFDKTIILWQLDLEGYPTH